jgi:hypothetical protein
MSRSIGRVELDIGANLTQASTCGPRRGTAYFAPDNCEGSAQVCETKPQFTALSARSSGCLDALPDVVPKSFSPFLLGL